MAGMQILGWIVWTRFLLLMRRTHGKDEVGGEMAVDDVKTRSVRSGNCSIGSRWWKPHIVAPESALIMTPRMLSRDNGMGSNATLPYKTALIVIVFLSIAVYNTLEIVVKVFQRFRRYQGVYFYSMLAASIGIIIHALGYFLRNYDIVNSAPIEITLACGGGMLMITGQSIVLWSRLHLISPGRRDRWLLWMIIGDCVIVQGGATKLFAGSNSSQPSPWLSVYAKFEVFQVTWFVFQESLISGLYI
jgi:hypothetical protein